MLTIALFSFDCKLAKTLKSKEGFAITIKSNLYSRWNINTCNMDDSEIDKSFLLHNKNPCLVLPTQVLLLTVIYIYGWFWFSGPPHLKAKPKVPRNASLIVLVVKTTNYIHNATLFI